MSKANSFTVTIGRSPVHVVVASGCWGRIGHFLGGAADRPIVVVTDENVTAHGHAARLNQAISGGGRRAKVLTLPAGEATKSFDTVRFIYERLARWRVTRDSVLVALGGGVISDVAGFAAATWLRGVRWIACPTTLEAMIDAAIGGKTGINLEEGKNLVGAVHQPAAVLVDPDALATLPQRDYVAGLAESIKHAAIYDREFFAWHEDHRRDILARRQTVLNELIVRNIRIKAAVIDRDERETTGRRMLLNFGHTLGHALESAANYRLRHGECVALGMVAAAGLSCRDGSLPPLEAKRLEALIAAFGLPTRLPVAVPKRRVMRYLVHDKKRRADGPQLVLLRRIGRADVVKKFAPEALSQMIASLRGTKSRTP